jgi:hypothetical protein
MASKNRDIRTQALVLGGVGIPASGEGIAVRISHGEVGAMVRGNGVDVKTQPGQPLGTLTISVYPEDTAAPILRRLANSRRLPSAAAVPFPGSYVNGSNGETSTWADAHFTAVPDVIGGTTTEVQTYTLELSGLLTEQL